MRRDQIVGVRQAADRVSWHAPGVMSDYDTLCGMDASDPGVGHHGVVHEVPRGTKITCVLCRSIWTATTALKLKASDFDADLEY